MALALPSSTLAHWPLCARCLVACGVGMASHVPLPPGLALSPFLSHPCASQNGGPTTAASKAQAPAFPLHPVPQQPGLLHAICPVPIPSTALGMFSCSPAHGSTDSHGCAESPHQGNQEPHQDRGWEHPAMLCAVLGDVSLTSLLGKGAWSHHIPLPRLCQGSACFTRLWAATCPCKCVLGTQNRRTLECVGLEGTCKSPLKVKLPGMNRDISQIKLLRAPFSPTWNLSRDGTSAASFSYLFQYLTTLTVKNFLILSGLN